MAITPHIYPYTLTPNGNPEFAEQYRERVQSVINELGLSSTVTLSDPQKKDDKIVIVLSSGSLRDFSTATSAIKRRNFPTSPASLSTLAPWKQSSTAVGGLHDAGIKSQDIPHPSAPE